MGHGTTTSKVKHKDSATLALFASLMWRLSLQRFVLLLPNEFCLGKKTCKMVYWNRTVILIWIFIFNHHYGSKRICFLSSAHFLQVTVSPCQIELFFLWNWNLCMMKCHARYKLNCMTCFLHCTCSKLYSAIVAMIKHGYSKRHKRHSKKLLI